MELIGVISANINRLNPQKLNEGIEATEIAKSIKSALKLALKKY